MKSLAVFFLVAVAVCAGLSISPETLGKLAQKGKEVIKTCKTETGASDEDLTVFAGKMPTTREAKCLISCFVKETGLEFDGDNVSDKFGLLETIQKEDPDYYNAKLGVIKACHAEVEKVDDDCEYYGKMFECEVAKAKEANIPFAPFSLD